MSATAGTLGPGFESSEMRLLLTKYAHTAMNIKKKVCKFVTIISVFVPGRSRAVQKLKKWVCTPRDRPGTNTEIIREE